MKYVKEMIQALVMAVLVGGPMFAYFMFVMKP